MVRPPYWVAARIFGAAADGVARARISGSYTLGTGRDLEDLHPRLYLDVVEAWIWEHFQSQEDADRWMHMLDAAPPSVWADVRQLAARALGASIGGFLAVLASDTEDRVDAAPVGWDSDSLLALSMASMGGEEMVID